jgi:hypothetical protein
VRTSAALAAILLVSCTPKAAAPVIAVDGAWARATLPGQMSSAIYFTVSNGGGEDRLLSVSTTAGNASLHSTDMDNGVMRMRPLQALEIPANSKVELKPGAMHVMLMGLKAPLATGSTFPLDLRFEKSGDRKVAVTVRPATAEGAMN